MIARSYVWKFLAFTAIAFALISGLGLAVDGYGLFGTRLIPESRFPSNLRLLKHGDRITKAIEISQRHGDKILFIGDSRTQHGLDPDSPALGGVQGYDAGLAAAMLAEEIVVLDYTLNHEPGIKRIVWGLSIEAFPNPIIAGSDFSESAFAGHGIAQGLMRHLFAADRVVASFKALMQARHKVRAPMKRNGVVTYGADLPEGPGIQHYFDAELRGEVRGLHGPMPQVLIDKAQRELADKLRELKAKGIDVDLVFVPVYIWRLEYYRDVGLEPQIAAWKRGVVATIAALQGAPGTGHVQAFDFSVPHPFVEQSVFKRPPTGERRYFLETSHFFPWLGDKVLDKVFGKLDPKDDPNFGRELTSATVDADLAQAKADLDAWEAANPDDVKHVHELVNQGIAMGR